MLGLGDFLTTPAAEREQLDIAAANLACAEGLPGADVIRPDECLRLLDEYAARVRRWTELGYEQFFRPHPEWYEHSEARFRIDGMLLVLQRYCGIRYDPAKRDVKLDAPYGLDDAFIHAPLMGPGGTCGTLPVVHAAVGRRLGYPIRLVTTKCHLFARWDDPATGERFNFEAPTEGWTSNPDDHYRNWPFAVSAEDERSFGYLKSLDPCEESAALLSHRGYVWQDRKEYRRAVACFVRASEWDPKHATWPRSASDLIRLWERDLRRRAPPRFPEVRLQCLAQSRR